MQDNRKLFVSVVALLVTLVFGMIGTLWTFAQDRQNFAVAVEGLTQSTRYLRADVSKVEGTLVLLVEQNASVLVLQHQVTELQRRLDKLETP